MRGAWLALVCAGAMWAGGPEWVRIPAGAWNGHRFEEPFWMRSTETTYGQFEAFALETGYRTEAERAGAERTWRKPGFAVESRQPVVYVTVEDAEAYCAWAGGRLPSDAEWEYAARAASAARHYWGDEMDGRYLWYRANAEDRPRAVATKRPNEWGLHDVEGNVWEWALAPDEKGERMGNRRGGSWVDCEQIDGGPGRPGSALIGLSKYFKIPVRLKHRYDDIGFRCARSGS